MIYHTDTVYSALIKGIIDSNAKAIVSECKAYLKNYEEGIVPNYATDLDKLIDIMQGL